MHRFWWSLFFVVFSEKKGISEKYYAVINANAISSDLSGDDLIKKFRAWLDILDLRFDKIKVTCLGHQKTY